MSDVSFTISPLGDTALLISFGNVVDEAVNNKVLSLFYHLTSLHIPGIKDIVPAYSSLAIHYNFITTKQSDPGNNSHFEFLAERFKAIVENNISVSLPSPRIIQIPVCYAEKYALDITAISNEKKISVDEIIACHTGKKYKVYMIGFLPGFAYMAEVDDQIVMPRKSTPRKKVEAGSVGIAGKQTGIYPLTSPGGWQIIGKTPLEIYRKKSQNPVLLQPGDEVEFYSITENEFANYKSRNS